MKYQQIYEDVSNMGWESISYITLAAAVWVFLKLLHTCFALPRRMNRTHDVQQMLQDKINDYEKYLEEQEEKERAAGVNANSNPEAGKSGLNGTPPDNNKTYEEKWKERREFLEMLKKELKRVRDGGDPYDWGNLLDDDETEKTDEADAASASTSGENGHETQEKTSDEPEPKAEHDSQPEDEDEDEDEGEVKDSADKKDD